MAYGLSMRLKGPSMFGVPTLTVDVISDVMCPWCYIGKKRLDAAIQLVPDIDVTVRWRPFQLDPTLPPEGKDRKSYLEAKFGGPTQAEAAYERVRVVGRDVGIPFAFEKISLSPNTLDCHRLLRWAADENCQGELAERLFSLYFVEGANLADRRTLISAAHDVGMATEGLTQKLASDLDIELTRAEIAHAGRMGVTGVPCFIFDNRYAAMGAQDAEVLANALRQLSADIANAPAN